jgi:hypothetical protein
MSISVPILLPVASYEPTDASVPRMHPEICNLLTLQALRSLQSPVRPSESSHDFPVLSPTPRHRRVPVTAFLVPLLTFATACTAHEAASSQFLVVKLPASIALLVLGAFGCGLAGFGLGLAAALQLLRASDRAAAQYHRAQIARVLGASSSVHASVQEVLSIVHRRTQELQRLVAMLQKEGAQ